MPHKVEMPSKLIFSGNGVYSGYIVDALVKMHADEGVRGDHKIGPTNVPVTLFWFVNYFHA